MESQASMFSFTPLRSLILCVLVAPFACLPAAGQVTLSSPGLAVTIDPATLGVTARTSDGETLILSAPQKSFGRTAEVQAKTASLDWTLPERGLAVTAELHGERLTLRFVSDKPGRITWPVIPGPERLKAYILPLYEGVYAPTDDAQWMTYLVDQGPMDTTADLSMPFIGLDLAGQTLTYIIENPFDNGLVFSRSEEESGVGFGASLTHVFMPNWDRWEYSVVIELGGASPIEPAKRYRAYLIERDEFVSMADKIRDTPRAERLLGAPHAYLWDAGVFSHLDATDWKGFCARLIAEDEAEADTLGKRIWDSLDEDARKSAVEITVTQWPYQYIKGVVAAQVSAYLQQQIESDTSDDPRATVLGAFCDHFDGLVRDYDTWGDGVSTKLLDKFRDAGLDRMNLCLGGLSDADLKPQVAQHADELGYLFGPYDSYHSIHRPDAHPDSTWETAQFGWELYESGAVVKADGSRSAGFKKVGYHLSPSAARPYVEKRVNAVLRRVPFNAIFVDCDAYGQFFDDYSPDHPATKRQDMLARLDRLRWLTEKHGLVVGSEGGNAYAVPAIHFAHGMFTPVIGWGDPDFKDKSSPYYMGAYWPPDGPTKFTKQVSLKPKYRKFFYDPRYRLPLYQAAFHDSVVATHHWGNASLKFKDKVQTVALLEQLYNVPPLYHLNHAEFKKHREHILAHFAFFSPLHRELALQPMTDFHWETEDRLVQRTTFGDGTQIVVNFTTQSIRVSGHSLPGRSAIAIRPDAQTLIYTPAPDSD
jgi:Glycosyl hydrolases related to GH101 family, GH129